MKDRIITPDEALELLELGRANLSAKYIPKWNSLVGGPMYQCYADEFKVQAKIAGHLNRGGTIKEAVEMFHQAGQDGNLFHRDDLVLRGIAELCDRGEALSFYADLKLTHDSASGYECAEWLPSGNLDVFIEKMQMLGQEDLRVQADFNGYTFHSDTITVDKAYLEVTGYTKKDFDRAYEEANRKWEAEREAEKAHMRETLPVRGREVLDEKFLAEWDRAVEIRVNDLYNGTDMVSCLEIVEALNNGCSLEDAKELLDNQGHSGISYGLVISEVKSFCDRGEEFADYVHEIEHGDRGPVIGE